MILDVQGIFDFVSEQCRNVDLKKTVEGNNVKQKKYIKYNRGHSAGYIGYLHSCHAYV